MRLERPPTGERKVRIHFIGFLAKILIQNAREEVEYFIYVID